MEHLYLNDDVQKTAALADLFLLLSIGLCTPTQELAQGLADGSYFTDFSDSLCAVSPSDLRYAAQAYYGRAPEEIYTEINREYTRLFLSPKHELVPLYESLLVHPGEKVSMFINPTAMHCDQVYRKTSFAYEEKNKYPADHAGIELRFFACLLARRAMALEAHNEADAHAAASALQDFAAAHLARWVQLFAGQVTMYTQIPFYTALADALCALSPLLAA